MTSRIELDGKPKRGDWIEVRGDLCEGAPCTAKVTERWPHGVSFKRWNGDRAFIRFADIKIDWAGERKGKRWFGISPRTRANPIGARSPEPANANPQGQSPVSAGTAPELLSDLGSSGASGRGA